MEKKSSYVISFRVDANVLHLLDNVVEEAHRQGATVPRNIVARALLMSALGIPVQTSAALESITQTYKMQKIISAGLSELIRANIDNLIQQAMPDADFSEDSAEEPEMVASRLG